GQRGRVAPDLCIGRYEGTETLLGRRARTDSPLHSSLWRRAHLKTCVVQPRSVAPSYGNPVRTRHRLLTMPGLPRRKKAKTALRSSWSLDKSGLIRVRLAAWSITRACGRWAAASPDEWQATGAQSPQPCRLQTPRNVGDQTPARAGRERRPRLR